MSNFQNKIVGVVGRKGSGKSTRVSTLLKYCPRILAWDPMMDHINLLPDVFEGVDEELQEYLWQAYKSKTFACSYAPSGDPEEEFEEISGFVYHYGRMLFCVEEAPLICKAGYMPPVFGKLVRTGRHRQIDLLWTAQRASEVSRTLTSSTDVFIFYSQTEPRDLDAIAERCGREVADEVAGLGLHDSFTWDVIDRKIVDDSPRLLKRPIPGE
jgi:energy-coupling factor transporter ATP-binding protein EcfA2